MLPHILVAGIGNIFLGDDAFGVEVSRKLAASTMPEGVRVVDFGIRGLDLTYALLEGYEAVILIDAVSRRERPGTLSVMELTMDEAAGEYEGVFVDAHNLDPVRVLRHAANMGAKIRQLILVGCEPTPLNESEDFGAEMSAAVVAVVEEAVPLVASLVAKLLRGEEIEASDKTITPEKEVERWPA